eukprot:6935094-Pyramimonas_sp.AAC.1
MQFTGILGWLIIGLDTDMSSPEFGVRRIDCSLVSKPMSYTIRDGFVRSLDGSFRLMDRRGSGGGQEGVRRTLTLVEDAGFLGV